MKLVFSSIKKGAIFEPEFQTLTPVNGTVEFKHLNTAGGIAVVYAPNGTGKSSLAGVLGIDNPAEDLFFSATNDSEEAVVPGSFHIIPDQINRNVIGGKETDYLVGRQIRREYELLDRINTAFDMAFTALANKYKTELKVTKVGDYFLTQIGTFRDRPYQTAFTYLRSIINNRKHGKDIDKAEFVAFIKNDENKPNLLDVDEEKKNGL